MRANIAELRSKLKLKPCPFCWHEPLLAREMLTADLRYMWGTGYRIYCPECEIAEAREIEAEEAAEKWNRRAPGWFSVDKVLPSSKELHVIGFDIESRWSYPCLYFRKDTKEFLDELDDNNKPVSITHWMPYPDAPKEDEEDE